MIRQCTDFFRLNNGQPACGNAYCHYVFDDGVGCPIKPSKNEPRVLRRGI